MKIIDLHQDLLPYEKYKKEAIHKDQTSWEGLDKNNFKITLPTANSWDYFWWDSKKPEPKLNTLITEEFLKYKNYCDKSEIFDIILNKKDFDKIWENENKKGIIVHMEGIDYFEDKKEYWEMLEKWYSYGWRSFGLIWNIKNHLAGGTETPEFGITELGKKVLAWAIKKNMIIDYAHMNRKVFWEVRVFIKENFPEQYKKPIYVSHSAIDSLFKTERNLDNKQLKEIKKTNGVVGIFFANGFITDIKKNKKNSTIYDFIKHIDYVKENFGIDNIAIGTDLGGFLEETIEGLGKVSDIKNLEKTLLEKKYLVEEIEKIFYKNAYRVIRELIIE